VGFSVQAAPRPFGSLEGLLLGLGRVFFDCEQNAQNQGKCGLLAQVSQVLRAAFLHFTLVAPREFT
jgi:hypothetical protein